MTGRQALYVLYAEFAIDEERGALYDLSDPLAEARPLDDRRYAVDHFFAKLLGLAGTMRTAAGRAEACPLADGN